MRHTATTEGPTTVTHTRSEFDMHEYSMTFDGAACDELFDAETDAEAIEEFNRIIDAIDGDECEADPGTFELRNRAGRVIARRMIY